MSTLTIDGTKLVIKYIHHYPPHIYGIREDGNFDTFMSPAAQPVFMKKPPRRKSKNHRALFTNRGLFERHKKKFDKVHRRFREDVEEAMDNQGGFVAPAKFVTECFLYDHNDWVAGAPQVAKDPETGERVMIVKPVTPEPLAVGRSFCSLKETNFSREVGRKLALERAEEVYRRKYA